MEKTLYKVLIGNDNIVGEKDEVLELLKTCDLGERIWIERVYTPQQYRHKQVNSVREI